VAFERSLQNNCDQGMNTVKIDHLSWK